MPILYLTPFQQASIQGIPGIQKLHYKFNANTSPIPHPFLGKLNDALQQGDAVMNALLQLKQQGFVPDLIYSYAGWGQNFYLKDVYPDTPFIGYFEWFMNPFGSEYNFDPAHPLDFDKQRYIRICNANMLLDLQQCDGSLTPTRWQQAQFPKEFRNKLQVIHDGVDTGFYSPRAITELKLANSTLQLADIELITYSTRGMEPFRGFPEFMRALAIVQQRRPNCHAVIMGSEDNYYSRAPANNAASHKAVLLDELKGKLDLSRVHFTGWLQKPEYLEVLRASQAHVYFTYPYVLSWSMMEAMATGCLVIGSRTAPVEEVITDGFNGLLVDFFDHETLADTLEQAITQPQHFLPLRRQARQTILDYYDQQYLVEKHRQWLNRFARTAS